MEAYALTDTGRVRSMNQDYIYASPEKVGFLPDLFLVADGMGGHKAGDYASRFMVENLVVYLNHRQNGPCVTQLKEGIKTVIIGRPNVGKSSLLNALLREDKAIVTNIAGTTRDIVEGSISIDGVVLNMIDTAGIRETDDIIESMGG